MRICTNAALLPRFFHSAATCKLTLDKSFIIWYNIVARIEQTNIWYMLAIGQASLQTALTVVYRFFRVGNLLLFLLSFYLLCVNIGAERGVIS